MALDARPHAPCTTRSVSRAAVAKSTTGVGRVEVELDQLACVLGDVAALRDDHGDRVTDVADVADRQRGRDLELLTEHGVPRLAEAAVEVLPRQHGDDTRMLPRLGHVEVGDRRLGHVAAQERGVEHAGQRHVVDVLTVTGEQAAVLLAVHRLTDEPRHAGHDAALIAAAARWTARRIPWYPVQRQRLPDRRLADLVVARGRRALEQRRRRDDEAGRAEAALQPVLGLERRLHRVTARRRRRGPRRS